MAGTIVVDVSVNAENGVWSFPFSRSFSMIQTNPGSHDPLHYLTTTAEAIGTGELVAPSIAVLFNIGSADIVYGPQSGGNLVPFGRIAPGEVALFRFYYGMTLMAKVEVGTGALWPIIFEG